MNSLQQQQSQIYILNILQTHNLLKHQQNCYQSLPLA